MGVTLVLLAGCATGGMEVEGDGRATRYRSRNLGYTVRAPTSRGSHGGVDVWQRVSVKHADIAFRGPDREFMSVISDCDAETERRPHRLASGLLVGLQDRRKLDSGVLETSQGEGWYQVYQASSEGRPVSVKTFTSVYGDCVFDWILVTAGSFALADKTFEAWRASFEPPALAGGRP